MTETPRALRTLVLGPQYLADKTKLLSTLLKSAYADAAIAKSRFKTFLDNRFDGSTATIQSAAESMFGNFNLEGVNTLAVREGFWLENFKTLSPMTVPSGVRTEVARAFASRAREYAYGSN